MEQLLRKMLQACYTYFSDLVNMNHIARYEPYKFIFNTGETIPIPPKKYNGVIKIYRNYLLNI